MNSSEIAFLALGLVLGGALGAAFLVAVGALPAPRREVRVTISPNSIEGRRSVTLSELSGFRDLRPPPGSPDDAAWPDRPATVPVATPAIAPEDGPPASSMRTGVPVASAAFAAATVDVMERPTQVAVMERPMPVTVQDVGASPQWLVRPRRPSEPVRPTLTGAAVGIAIVGSGEPETGMADPSPVVAATSGRPEAAAKVSADPCADPRRAMEEVCAAAATRREQSRVAANAARDAQRAYDTIREEVDRARALSDPKTIAAAKAAMREQFRKEEKAAATPDDAEAAARRWLHGINQANNDVRSALRVVESGTPEMHERLARVEQLTLEADAARISAEGADESCRIARDELARCEEHVAATSLASVPEDVDPFAGAWPTQQDETSLRSSPGTPVDELAGQSAILRVVRGDRAARDRVVAAVAGSDPAAVADWQIQITALSDAIVARAIEAGYLALPEGHPFWGLFTDRERREIVEALASLGFRFDGLGGFADGRVPATRDLSLAVGYAGLDRMRIRVWPRETEIASLYTQAEVAADEWLVWAAGDLELGPLTDALGPRAATLGAIWDAWGRVRPALIATD